MTAVKNLPRVRFISKHKISSFGTTQLRCVQPAEFLSALGYRTSASTIYRTVPGRNGIIVLHRAVPDPYTVKFIEYAKLRGNVLIYDTDDLIFTQPSLDFLNALGRGMYSYTAQAVQEVIRACDGVFVSTDFLAEQVKPFTGTDQVHVVRNAVSADFQARADLIFQKKSSEQGELVTIGYLSGSATHEKDFCLVQPALLEILQAYPHTRIVLAGMITFSEEFLAFGDRFHYQAFVPYANFPDLLGELDINLVPLDLSTDFAHAKSELKFLEAGICGIPSIVSPSHTFRSVIKRDINGIFSDDGEWFEKISGLVDDSTRRRQLGRAAREHVLATATAPVRAEELARTISRISRQLHRPASSESTSRQLRLRGQLEIGRLTRWIRARMRRFVTATRASA